MHDKISEIKSKFLNGNGWLIIYEAIYQSFNDTSDLFSCLVATEKIDKYDNNHEWPISKGLEGKPTVWGDNSYYSYREEGVEPFIFFKKFQLKDFEIEYIDIAEEFVLYFNLYEDGADKKNRTFYYIDDYGASDEVIIIRPNLVKVKLKYLKEYIAIRKMYFVISFDFLRLHRNEPKWKIDFQDKKVLKDDVVYQHMIKSHHGIIQNWIAGNVFFKPGKVTKTHFDLDETKDVKFIVGHDQDGEPILEKCCNRLETNFTIAYFDKSVLEKYYNEPHIYCIDEFSLTSKFYYLKLDNNVSDYVSVFLNDLCALPGKELLHWKQYNIPPKDGMSISRNFFKVMVEGEWAGEPEVLDQFFKFKYSSFSKIWIHKFGWPLFKPLAPEDEYLFTALHKITTNNKKAFCKQTLTIVKLMIDRLNEKELEKDLNIDKKGIKGIGKFEAFLNSHCLNNPEMVTFLRNLQSLRSGLIAHTFSKDNKNSKKAIEYFGIGEKSYVEISDDIFSKAIFTINILETHFNLNL